MSTVCLCMIVRDEAGVIDRCLGSVRDLVDYWVVCDTGSTDGTQERVRKALRDIPGELHERPWVNFGHNRTEALDLARGKADYLLLIDADMTLRVEGELPELVADSYTLRHASDLLEYRIKRLVRSDRDWHYVGATHEYLASSGPEDERPLDALVVEHHADGGSRGDKFERDIELLGDDLARDPDNPRTIFYLAQSYRDLGRRDRALMLYQQRMQMGGWDEEVFYSAYQVGVLKAELEDWPGAFAALLAAWQLRPQRLEPVYELAWRLRKLGQYRTGYLFVKRVLDRPRPDDVLFVQPWVYRWGLLFEYSILAYWVGDFRSAYEACRRLAEMPDLPDEHRLQNMKNRDFCLKQLAAAGEPIRLRPPTAAERRSARLAEAGLA